MLVLPQPVTLFNFVSIEVAVFQRRGISRGCSADPVLLGAEDTATQTTREQD